MFLKHTFFIIALSATGLCNAQTLVLQPDAAVGKDALLNDFMPNTNFGLHPDQNAVAWTNGGTQVLHRSIVDFDLSTIPTGATVTTAALTLYHNPTSVNASALHQSRTSSNASILQRITSIWDEATVTWNTQPSYSNSNEILLAQSTSGTEDYAIDVTQLVQDMVDNPSTSFGFLLQLQNETYYASLVFASSDNADVNNHPRLEVYYTSTADLNDLTNTPKELVKIVDFLGRETDYKANTPLIYVYSEVLQTES